jgi:DNA polymerase III sliding clamp (beta) subunit (PCNA family)
MAEAKFSREEFLSTLESLQSGLAQREQVEQSSCFIFENGNVYTYNEEISCIRPSKLPKSFVGAVQAKNLLESLRKLPDDEITVEFTENQCVVKGKGRKVWVNLEATIHLKIDSISRPEKWVKLHEDFAEAVATVSQCAGKDNDKFDTVCVHIHPTCLEASDGIQACRWMLESNLKESILVRAASIKNIATLGVTEMGESDGWIHFRNGKGLIFSCHRFANETYPHEALSKLLKMKGTVASLPKTLADAVERAKIFSSEIADGNNVHVELSNGRVTIKGEGVTGGFSERRKLAYTGEPITMQVSPDMLIRVIREHNEFVIVPKKLIRVDGGVYQFAASLFVEKVDTNSDESDDVSEPKEVEKPAEKVKKKKDKAPTYDEEIPY